MDISKIKYGLLGGLFGAVVLGIIASMMPIPLPMGGSAPFFAAVAMMMTGMAGMSALAIGWALHLIVGLVIGAVFALVVGNVHALDVDRKAGKALGEGAVAGIVVFFAFMMPIVMMAMPSLIAMMPMLVVGAFVGHIILGLVLGATYVKLSK